MDYRPLRTTRNFGTLRDRPGWYRIQNLADAPTQVTIYDEIGFLGVAADVFMQELSAIGGDIEMHINSPGGDVHAGIAIYNQLKQRPGVLSVVVDGLAASAASFIAMAASPGRLAMAPHSQMMIHNGFGMAIGDADDMEKMAGLLRKTTANIAGIYSDRSGKPASYWLSKMAAETWYDDDEAVADGLADYILGQQKPPQNAWDLSVYVNWRNADGNHAPMTGTHTHAHPAYGADGHEPHEHDHDGDADHDHGHPYDPDGDGDDDSTAAGDTDHDYVLPDGKPGPKAAASRRWLNAGKYKQADRDEMAKSGEAMPDGSYPVRDEEDLGNAIRAVGRGGADHDAIRRHIIKRAKALGKSDAIPDSWSADGSLGESSSSPDNRSEAEIFAMFARELDQLGAGRE